jgi:hypothetical protein
MFRPIVRFGSIRRDVLSKAGAFKEVGLCGFVAFGNI